MKEKLSVEQRAKRILDSLTKEELIDIFTDAGFEVSEGEGKIMNFFGEEIYDQTSESHFSLEFSFTNTKTRGYSFALSDSVENSFDESSTFKVRPAA